MSGATCHDAATVRLFSVTFHHSTADFLIPDGKPLDEALPRITHLGIGAHQDDLEFMAFEGILRCHDNDDEWFGGVVCTDGAGSSRSGEYQNTTDSGMKEVRREEQRRAARIGNYGVMIQLDHASETLRNPASSPLVQDLRKILLSAQPKIVYTHNPADKHTTHVAVVLATLEAIKMLPEHLRPSRVIGCEVWRDLDWMPDEDKVIMDVSGGDLLAATLMECFQSQIAGGKRYDLAILGRRAAHATFLDPRKVDTACQVILGMDLTPLVTGESRSIQEFVSGLIDRFRSEVTSSLR